MKTGFLRFAAGMLTVLTTAAAWAGTAAASETPAQEEPAAVPVISISETAVSPEDALRTVLSDAAIEIENAVFSTQINEFSDGRNLYEIDFLVPGKVKYDYKVDALTGELTEHEQTPWEAEDDADYQALLEADQTVFQDGTALTGEFLRKAADTALEKAGVQEDEICYYKAGIDYEDGKLCCEIGFLLPGEWKYDFHIDPQKIEIITHDKEPWTAEDDLEYEGLISSNVPAEPAAEFTANQAIELAVQDAGFAINDVAVVKNTREFDDGLDIYDISFYGPDGFEYDYEILAADGTIIDKSVELDD